jgi:hypothetical protein
MNPWDIEVISNLRGHHHRTVVVTRMRTITSVSSKLMVLIALSAVEVPAEVTFGLLAPRLLQHNEATANWLPMRVTLI